MKITELLKEKQQSMRKNKPVTIAFLGDSVTQGCFECFMELNGDINTIHDYKSAYSTRVREILNLLYPRTQVNIINSGISGDNALGGLTRLTRDVLSYHPDLVVVCFGLNDCNDDSVEPNDYKASLKAIFAEIHAAGKDVIFMTPNMMNTYVPHTVTDDFAKKLGVMFAERQNNGYFDSFMDAAREACAEEGVPLCDCYKIWRSLNESGVDTTALLSNGLNHPTRDLHLLFAWELVRTMLEN